MKIDPPGSLGSILQVPGAETGIKHRLVDFFAHLFDLLSGVFLEALAFFLMVFFPGSFFLGGGGGGGDLRTWGLFGGVRPSRPRKSSPRCDFTLTGGRRAPTGPFLSDFLNKYSRHLDAVCEIVRGPGPRGLTPLKNVVGIYVWIYFGIYFWVYFSDSYN